MSEESVAKPTTLYDHLRELQFRLLASVSVLIVGGVIGYFFYSPIFQLIRSPLHTPLYYSTPAGSFLFVMKIALLVAIAFALPVIIYNLIMFIQPAFATKLSKKRIYATTTGSIILAVCGALFAFYIILPASIKFFVGFQVTGLNALLDASTYLNFVVNIVISFMIVFQLPLIISFIDHIKPISPKKLLKYEKYVIIGAALIGVLAPFSFDPITELLIAAPIVVLFNLSIVLVALEHRYKKSLEMRALRRSTLVTDEPEQLLPQLSFEDASRLARSFTLASEPELDFDFDLDSPILEMESSREPVKRQKVSNHHWMDVATMPDSLTTHLQPRTRIVPAAAYRRSRPISDFR
jgi:sec-independent protein translocase protein TatC